MELVSLVIVFISIILLAYFIFNLTCNMVGGEYIPSYSIDMKGNPINPTISQICWNNYSSLMKELIQANIGKFDNSSNLIKEILLEDSLNALIQNASYKFNDEVRINASMTKMKTVSDAHIDLLGCILSYPISDGFAICEWHGDMKGESSEFVTKYSKNTISINRITSELEEEIGESIRDSNIRLYIEFSYGEKQRSNLYYKNIHKFTIDLIQQLLQVTSSISKNIIVVIAIRVLINANGTKYSIKDIITKLDKNKYIGTNYIVECYDESKFETMVIPKTTILSYDEEIVLYTNDKSLVSIQIEHSENGSRHKSNYMEFLARNLEPLIVSKKEFFDCLSLTNYKYLLYNPKTKSYDIKFSKGSKDGNVKFVHNMSLIPQSNAFMKAFGKFGDML